MNTARGTATRILGAALVTIVGLLASASPAFAAASISVSPSTASPGGSITISGNVPVADCPPSDGAQLTSTSDLFPPDGFGPQATRNATGDFTTSYSIPAATPPGSYSIGMRCGGGNVGISADLTVTAAAAASISVKPSSAPAGTSVTFSGKIPVADCPANDPAELTSTDLLGPDGFGPQASRTPVGGFTIDFAIPKSTAPGSYPVGLRCGGGNVGVTTTLTVTPVATSTSSTTTSSTTTSTTLSSSSSAPLSSSSASSSKSNSALPWILFALAAILAAVLIAFYVRSRRAPPAT